jgi:hypothetical protein
MPNDDSPSLSTDLTDAIEASLGGRESLVHYFNTYDSGEAAAQCVEHVLTTMPYRDLFADDSCLAWGFSMATIDQQDLGVFPNGLGKEWCKLYNQRQQLGRQG